MEGLVGIAWLNTFVSIAVGSIFVLLAAFVGGFRKCQLELARVPIKVPIG